MSNTYIKSYIHIVFAVKNRETLIPLQWLPYLHRYIDGVIKNCNCHALAVGGTPNHVHILVAMHQDTSVSTLVKGIKTSSNKYLNSNRATPCLFSWQSGYAAISVSPTLVDKVSGYISRQMQHHHGVSLRNELIYMLTAAGIEFDERYLPQNVE